MAHSYWSSFLYCLWGVFQSVCKFSHFNIWGNGGLCKQLAIFFPFLLQDHMWIQPGRWRVPMSTACSFQSPPRCFANWKSQNSLIKGPGGTSYHPRFMEKKTEALRGLFTPPNDWNLQQTQCSITRRRDTHLLAVKKKKRKKRKEKEIRKGSSRMLGWWHGGGGELRRDVLGGTGSYYVALDL